MKYYIKMAFLLGCVVAFSSCATQTPAQYAQIQAENQADQQAQYQTLSAGQIGCLPNDIQIINIQSTSNNGTLWIAECKGVKYICTNILPSMNSASFQTSCAAAK